MKPAPFDYAAARAPEEAVALLAGAAGEAKLLAGGQSLVPLLNFRLLRPALLVDVNPLADLAFIEERDGGLRIGALTRHRAVETSPLVAAHFPVLAAALGHVAHLAIRNRGTFGGSLAHADPAAELPMLALLLDARIATLSPAGPRTIPARDFFSAALTTALGPAEIVTHVDLPPLPPATGWGFEELSRRTGDFAIAAVAAAVTLADGRCAEARIAMAGVGETPLRASAAEALLRGRTLDAAAVEEAARAAREAARPASDLHASADYRRHLVEVLARRALHAAWTRAGASA